MSRRLASPLIALLLIGSVAAAVILLTGRAPRPQDADEDGGSGEETAVLIERLTVPDPAQWKRTVGDLAARGDAAVPMLIVALEHAHRAVREGAAHALGDIGERAAPAIDALIRTFEDEDDFVRWKAARALGRIGPAASRAVPVLEPVADNEREAEVVRATAQRALEQIRGDR